MYGYRKIYHEDILKTLINSVKLNQACHAYIFEGIDGLGRHESARLFAAALTCSAQIVPCGQCPSCIQAKSNSNIDIITVAPPKGKKTIGVNQIRDVISDAYIKPFAAKHKVYIVDSGDVMTVEAQNALLKILEEPPEYTVFIIISSNVSSLLQTVISRSMIIHFPELGEERMIKYISEMYPSEMYRSEFLAKYSQGIPGTVDRIVVNEIFEPLRQSCFNILDAIFSSKKSTAYDFSDFLEENKDNIDLTLDFITDFIRDMLLIKCDAHENVINTDLLAELRKKCFAIDDKVIVRAIESLIHAREFLSKYISLKTVSVNIAFSIKEAMI